MLRTAFVVALGFCLSTGTLARAQSPSPQAYTLKVVRPFADRQMTLRIVRDGARERIESAFGEMVMTSLYDFEAHRVYWIGWSGPGTCSSGRYLSSRAPVDQDPVTGTGDLLPKLADGRSRKAEGAGTIGGVPARVEAFVGGTKPAGPDAAQWPTRVWLAEQGGTLLKLQGAGQGGKPTTLLEVTQLTLGKPQGATLEPPPECTATDSEMDDSGQIRAHVETSIEVKASGTVDLGTGKASSTSTPPAR